MSANLSVNDIHGRTSAIFEKLHNEKGQPNELDEAFIQEYFKLVGDGLADLNAEDGEDEPRAPHTTAAKLSQQDRGLIDVAIPSKSEKFRVSNVQAVKTISGTSQRFGSDRGRGTYLMTSVKGIPNITIKTGSAVVTFIGTPTNVQTESGSGEWVKL